MISIVLALVLPMVLLYGGFFYSGHLLMVSVVFTLVAWRVLSFIGFPFLTLEAVDGARSIDRAGSVLILTVLLLTATVLDSYISSKFDPDDAAENTRSASAIHRDR